MLFHLLPESNFSMRTKSATNGRSAPSGLSTRLTYTIAVLASSHSCNWTHFTIELVEDKGFDQSRNRSFREVLGNGKGEKHSRNHVSQSAQASA